MSNQSSMDYLVISRMANAHILVKADSFVEVARDLFGVQAQIQNAAAIAYCLRLQNETETISQYFKQYEQMKLVRLWGIRTTLHSYRYEDWNLVLSQVSSADNWFRKKMIKQGCDLEKLVQRAVSYLQGIDVFDRDYLIQKGIPAEYLGPWGDFLIELNNRGIICHNTSNDIHKKKFINATKYVSFNTGAIDLYQEKKEIAKRYFGAFSPATIKDFAHWLGCAITQAKSYIALIQEDLFEIEYSGKSYYILNVMKTSLPLIYEKYKDNSECWLLSKFDPLLLAYDDKSWIVDPQYQNSVWKSAGHVEGVIVKNWKAIATWKYSLRKGHIGFELFPFCKAIESIDLCLYEKFKSIAGFMECKLDYIRMN